MAEPLTLAALKQLVEDLADQFLGTYTESLRTSEVERGKDVNDALWGTISFTKIEVALLDSPLLQRLRFIRQRGAAHWVYPGAVHTRFEHLLGSMHLVQSMATALNQAAKALPLPATAAPPIQAATVQILRLAVMLREAAQMAFSQVSEGTLSDSPVLATISKDLSEDLRAQLDVPGEDVSFTQVVGYFLARSPAVKRFLELVVVREGETSLQFTGTPAAKVEKVVACISLAITGRRIDDKLPLVHELVAGPFDAERIDGLMRDARFAGLPTLLDEQRILQKLAVKKMRLADMPPTILTAMSGGADDEAWLFGIKGAAAGVLDELQLANMLATAKVYQHSKVLAVEQMLRSAISALMEVADAGDVLRLLFSKSDDAFLSMRAADLGPALQVDALADEGRANQKLEAAAELLTSLRERRLWVRAFQFPEWRSTLDLGAESSEAMEAMRADFRHIERGPVFMGHLRDAVHEILNMLGERAVDRPSLDVLVSARSLELTSTETEVGRAYIIHTSRRPYQFSRSLSARDSWLDRYNAGQPRDYIFCPPSLADVVFVAFERMARMRHEVVLPDGSLEASKREPSKIRVLKRRLISHGYWHRTPYDIRPEPEALRQLVLPRFLRSFHELRTRYLAPVRGETAQRDPDIESDTRDWLRQFDDEDHVKCALQLLSKIKMLDRNDFYKALVGFVEANAEFIGAWVVPFGSTKDSGNILAYFAGDGIERGLVTRLGSLEDYAKYGDGSPLIFVDDIVGSGGQACDMLARWLGRDDLGRDLGEEREPLPEEQAVALRAARVGFLFVAGWNVGLQAIRDICPQLGLNATVSASLTDGQLPFALDVLSQAGRITTVAITAFVARCEDIGRQLVMSQPRGGALPAEKVEQRKLGYGNRGMLLVTPFNTPTQTLTALWMDGEVDGQPWKSLFPRRKKT